MRTLLSGLIAFCACGADFTSSANFRVQTTPRSAVICYTVSAPDIGTVGTWEVSTDPSYAPLEHDVDTTLYSGSSSDNRMGSYASGRTRCFLAGEGSPGLGLQAPGPQLRVLGFPGKGGGGAQPRRGGLHLLEVDVQCCAAQRQPLLSVAEDAANRSPPPCRQANLPEGSL